MVTILALNRTHELLEVVEGFFVTRYLLVIHAKYIRAEMLVPASLSRD